MPEQGWFILGPGAIGTLYAHFFETAGTPVTLLHRKSAQPPPARIESNGQLHTLNASLLPVSQASNIKRVIVATKAYDAVSALRQLENNLDPQACVVLLVNGMGISEAVQTAMPGLNVACATTTQAAFRHADGRICHAGTGETRVGKTACASPPRWFSDWQRSVERCVWDANIDTALWQKLAINAAINPLTAVHKCRNGHLAQDALLRARVAALCAEIAAISAAAGYVDTANSLPGAVADVIAATSENQSSMLQDVQRNKPTEIEYINGYLLRTAEQHNVPAPLNREVYEQVIALAQ